jgi:hypothetical protein
VLPASDGLICSARDVTLHLSGAPGLPQNDNLTSLAELGCRVTEMSRGRVLTQRNPEDSQGSGDAFLER